MIHITYDMKQYQEILNEIISSEDTVVELGCHIGNSTKKILSKTSSQVLSLDNSPEAEESMSKLTSKYPNLRFINADVRLNETLIEVTKKMSRCDVLSVDLGGGYHPDTTFKVYFIWASTLKPKKTIIRNRGLIDFVNSSKTYEDYKSTEGYLETSNNAGVPPQLKEFKLWSNKI